MDFAWSEEQKMLQTSARDFLEAECPERLVREIWRGDKGYSPELWRKIADLGWLGLAFPEQYGGTGGSILDLTALYEEMGRALFPGPHLSTVVLCGLTILAVGNEEQKSEFLPKIAKGDSILALALTEPGSSWSSKAWEAEGVTVRATADGNNYIINGTKLFVHDAHIADYLLCATRTRVRGASEKGITLFLVDAKSPGISYTPFRTTDGLTKQSEVVFDRVRVPKKNMVGELNGGWAPLFKAIQRGAIMLCAEMVGAGFKLVDSAADYAKTRITFEVPIGIHQHIQEYLVQMVVIAMGAEHLTHEAAWKLSENMPCDFEIAAAKAWCSDGYEKLCRHAHEVFGGVAYHPRAHVLPMYSRRSLRQQLYLGDTRFWRKKVAEAIDNWPPPVRPRGKPLGLWNKAIEDLTPAWTEVWKPEDLQPA